MANRTLQQNENANSAMIKFKLWLSWCMCKFNLVHDVYVFTLFRVSWALQIVAAILKWKAILVWIQLEIEDNSLDGLLKDEYFSRHLIFWAAQFVSSLYKYSSNILLVYLSPVHSNYKINYFIWFSLDMEKAFDIWLADPASFVLENNVEKKYGQSYCTTLTSSIRTIFPFFYDKKWIWNLLTYFNYNTRDYWSPISWSLNETVDQQREQKRKPNRDLRNCRYE